VEAPAPRRKLATLLSSDVVGYSRLMADDDHATLEALTVVRGVMTERISLYNGRVVDLPGDALLAEFGSPVEAVNAAIAIQDEMRVFNHPLPERRRMRIRVGVNLGDVLERDGALYGEGVNIAARLETLADHGGICVSGTVYDQIKNRIDRACEFIGDQSVKNIADPVRSYRIEIDGAVRQEPTAASPRRRSLWLLPVAATVAAVLGFGVWQVTSQTAQQEASEDIEAAPLLLPEEPSVAVLPFENRSADPDQDYFIDGVTEDIIAALSRFNELFVISFNSTRRYKDQAVAAKDVGQALGVRYVVQGGIRRSSETIRVTAQLIDAKTGENVWADSFDRAQGDIFEIQDEITQRVAAMLGAKLEGAALADAQRKAPADLTAYDYVLRAQRWWQTVTPEDHAVARDLLEQAVALHPDYARALAELGFLYLVEHVFRQNPRPDPLGRAREALTRAVELDPNDSKARFYLASYYYWTGQTELFVAESDKSLALNPNDPRALGELGIYVSGALGELERGAELARRAMRLDPNFPPYYRYALFREAYFTERYEDALAELKRINLTHLFTHQVFLAISHAQLGNRDEAGAAVARVIELQPEFSAVWFMDRFQFHDRLKPAFLDGAEKAGLPIGPTS